MHYITQNHIQLQIEKMKMRNLKNIVLKRVGIFSIFLLSCSISLHAQNLTVSGTVTDNAYNEPLIGVTIVVRGTSHGTVTDIDGKYSISGVPTDGILEFTYVGMQPQNISVNGRSTIDVVMGEDPEMLEEVVVTGYGGTQLRSKVTNSISKVKEDVLKQGLFSNPAQALSGAVPGLKVEQTSGNPGATPTITLRGGTDYNGSGSPLIIVDGQVRANLSDMNPEDIESMEVLKDAGATAIYGARANNGVILITTKRGKDGGREINVKAKFGVNNFRGAYDFMNAGDYLYWMRKSYKNADYSGQLYPDGAPIKGYASLGTLANATPYGTGNRYFADDGVTPLDGNRTSTAVWSPMKYADNLAFLLDQGWQTMIDPVYGDKIIYKNTNIADFNIQTPSFSQDYNVNMSGGNDKGKYYSGIGYNDSEGTAIGNWYKRLTFTLNADYKINDWLTSISSFNFADAKWYGLSPNSSSEENYFSRVLSLPSTFRGYNANNEPLLGPNSGDGNQQLNIDKLTQDNNTDKFTMSQAFNFDITSALTFKISANWFYSEEKNEYFTKDFLRSPGTYSTTRQSGASYYRDLNQTYNAVLNYNKQINDDHYLSAMGGYEYYDTFRKGFSASGSGAPTDDFADLGYTSTDEGLRAIDSWHWGERLMSFFGRANYDYQSKYLVSVVLRRDGTSKLSKQNRWGWFPGISGGWVFTREPFMEQYTNILSFGKARASFGVNGNVNKDWVGQYTVQGSYGTNKYNGNIGYLLTGLPNPYLTWETSRTIEGGFDLGFLNNKITTNITYYVRNTYNKFANITVPSTSGITSVTSNNGEMQNKGLEIEINWRALDTKDWKANINFNTAYSINKIVSLPDNGLEKNRQNAFQVYTGNGDEKKWVGGYQEGQRPGDVYLFIAEGIYKNQSEIPANLIDITSGNNGSNGRPLYGGAEGYNRLTDTQKANALPITPGDVKWKDMNGDGVIDNFDMEKVGNFNPKWTGGFNASLSWKNLTLSTRLDFALDFIVVDTRTPWIMGNMQGTYNTIEDTKETWSTENVNGKYPLYTWADQLGKRNYARSTSMYAYRGDYLSFRELSLSYRLPKSVLEKISLTNVELSVTGQNLGYWTKAKHVFSPEKTSNWGGYPLPRIAIFGINLSL